MEPVSGVPPSSSPVTQYAIYHQLSFEPLPGHVVTGHPTLILCGNCFKSKLKKIILKEYLFWIKIIFRYKNFFILRKSLFSRVPALSRLQPWPVKLPEPERFALTPPEPSRGDDWQLLLLSVRVESQSRVLKRWKYFPELLWVCDVYLGFLCRDQVPIYTSTI